MSLLLLAAVGPSLQAQQNPFRLKDPDQKRLCLACHSDFEQVLRKRFVHTPVKGGECAGCHDPHVSSHGKLLAQDAKLVCATCHGGIAPAGAKSVHKVVRDGECAKCHDPHASDTAANLIASGNDLCLGCHTQLGDAIKKAKFRHSPVDKGCLTCHTAHASGDATHLLQKQGAALCVGCHKTDTQAFVSRHMSYPVGKASCTSCHDPHGSSQSALLLDYVHEPVANRACTQCHEPPDGPNPFATKRRGFELCKGCHNDMVTTAMGKRQLHWPVADRQGCVNCHDPHASKYGKLVKADTSALCGRCHTDTLQRIAATKVQHGPVREGKCVGCHSPHSADGAYLLDQPPAVKVCGTCHDYSGHSAHPLGADVVDPRNKNLRVDCSSCHKGHGTDYEHMLLAATTLDLCTQCHKQFGR